VLAILSGTGANGKGVCYETVIAAFGDYGIVVDPKVVMASKNALHGTHYLDLMGRRLVVTSETSEGGRLDAAIVKRLTGGDRIRANRMHRDTIEFRPSHTIAMVTNHKPGADANDEALWRRLRVVGFDVVIPEDRRDAQLSDKLRGNDLAAVLAWCWHGWLDYRETGLAAPAAVTRRTDEYRAEGDALGEFLSEQCVTHQYARVGASDLFRAFQGWSIANNVPAMNQHQFGRAVEGRGFVRKPSAGRKVYVGLGLAANDEKAGQDAFDE
jgi:putative DNA primase/helicase